MIKCMIVGGDRANKLAEFIRQTGGGSVQVLEENVYYSFQRDHETLSRSLIRVDKLVYLVDEINSIREDFRNLEELMKNPTFFNIGEIWIFGKDNEDNTRAMNSFQTIMSDLKYDKYFINLETEDAPFVKIYRSLIGRLDDEEDSGIKYKYVYRAYRGEDSKKGYDAKEFNKNLEPKIKDNYSEYEKAKDAARKIETGRVIKEPPVEDIQKLDLVIDTIDVSKVAYKKNIFIVSGRPKSGVSAFASAFCMSLNSNKSGTINLIDISGNCGSARTCIRVCKNVTVVDNRKLLTGEDYSNKRLAVYESSSIKTQSVKTSYLKYILSIPNRAKSDLIVIDCDYEDLYDVVNICGSRINTIFICAQEVKDEIILIGNAVNKLASENHRVMIYTNNSIKFDSSFERMSPVDVKNMYPNTTIIKAVDLSSSPKLWTLAQL